MTGLSYPTVLHAIDLYKAGGWSASRPTARGRTQGQGRVLTAEQEQQIQLAMIAIVTNAGNACWMIIDDAFIVDKLIEFLKALIKEAGKKVLLIVDNRRVHHVKPVKAWLQDHKDQIEMFYLPSYSLELNPEERLNADLKQAIGKKVPVRIKAKLREAANEHMTRLAQLPESEKLLSGSPGKVSLLKLH